MNLEMQIDMDCKSLECYFRKLFSLLECAQKEELGAPIVAYDTDATEYDSPYRGFSHLIKPDMLSNIYSLVDFYSKQACEQKRRVGKLNLGVGDIKGKNDLHARNKYLSRYVGIDMSPVNVEYENLDNLREIRNVFIHSGGHLAEGDEKKKRKIENIKGIRLIGLLIIIEECFVWDVLNSAKSYLKYIATA